MQKFWLIEQNEAGVQVSWGMDDGLVRKRAVSVQLTVVADEVMPTVLNCLYSAIKQELAEVDKQLDALHEIESDLKPLVDDGVRGDIYRLQKLSRELQVALGK